MLRAGVYTTDIPRQVITPYKNALFTYITVLSKNWRHFIDADLTSEEEICQFVLGSMSATRNYLIFRVQHILSFVSSYSELLLLAQIASAYFRPVWCVVVDFWPLDSEVAAFLLYTPYLFRQFCVLFLLFVSVWTRTCITQLTWLATWGTTARKSTRGYVRQSGKAGSVIIRKRSGTKSTKRTQNCRKRYGV